jgi:hypothetical protein
MGLFRRYVIDKACRNVIDALIDLLISKGILSYEDRERLTKVGERWNP